MQGLADRTDVEFVFVYQREPHARQMAFADVEQPKDLGERCALAQKTCDELALPSARVWIDGMDDQSRALFGDLPSPAIVIDPRGVIRSKLPWAEPDALTPIVQQLLAAQPSPRPPQPAAGDRAGTAANPAPAVAPDGDSWPALTACATLAVERPTDPHWRDWIDRLLACPEVAVQHWALQRLVEHLRAGDDTAGLQSAMRRLAALRRAQPWLEPVH
jgi:hypothetical protein